LEKVERTGENLVVAFNVNEVDVDEIRKNIIEEAQMQENRARQKKEMELERKTVMDSIKRNTSLSFTEKMKLAGAQGRKMLQQALSSEDESEEFEMGDNYYDLLSRTFSLMNHINSKQAIALHKPDILVSMPFDAYGDIADYAKADEIAETGRILMKAALDRYEDEHR
jgi:hypothetical protein